jgi:hypothetical protein
MSDPLERAGLFVQEQLSRRLPGTQFVVPNSLALMDGDLVWDWEAGAKPKEVATHRALEEFVDLADAEEEQILVFARRYGPLYLTRDEIPSPLGGVHRAYGLISGAVGGQVAFDAEHDAADVWNLLADAGLSEDGFSGHEGYARPPHREGVHLWRSYARHVKGLLYVAARLHAPGGSRPGRAEDWRLVGDPGRWEQALVGNGGFPVRGQTVEGDRQWLAVRVRMLLHATGASLWFTWDPKNKLPTIAIDGIGALGGVARQLAFNIGKQAGFKICKYCGDPFPPKRKRVQCQSCFDSGEAAKAAKRQYKERKRAKDRKWRGAEEEILALWQRARGWSSIRGETKFWCLLLRWGLGDWLFGSCSAGVIGGEAPAHC